MTASMSVWALIHSQEQQNSQATSSTNSKEKCVDTSKHCKHKKTRDLYIRWYNEMASSSGGPDEVFEM